MELNEPKPFAFDTSTIQITKFASFFEQILTGVLYKYRIHIFELRAKGKKLFCFIIVKMMRTYCSIPLQYNILSISIRPTVYKPTFDSAISSKRPIFEKAVFSSPLFSRWEHWTQIYLLLVWLFTRRVGSHFCTAIALSDSFPFKEFLRNRKSPLVACPCSLSGILNRRTVLERPPKSSRMI